MPRRRKIIFNSILTIGEFINRLEDICRPDAAQVLISGCPLYRITNLEEEEMNAAAAAIEKKA